MYIDKEGFDFNKLDISEIIHLNKPNVGVIFILSVRYLKHILFLERKLI